jgi:hypothetical protein
MGSSELVSVSMRDDAGLAPPAIQASSASSVRDAAVARPVDGRGAQPLGGARRRRVCGVGASGPAATAAAGAGLLRFARWRDRGPRPLSGPPREPGSGSTLAGSTP